MATPEKKPVSVDTPFFQGIRAGMDPETAAEVRAFQFYWMNGGAAEEQAAYERELQEERKLEELDEQTREERLLIELEEWEQTLEERLLKLEERERKLEKRKRELDERERVIQERERELAEREE